MLSPELFRSKFEAGFDFRAYVATGNDRQRAAWDGAHAAVSLSQEQRSLMASFRRRINVLVSSGVWCGDCVQQCPMLERIEAANPVAIRLRLLDRDAHRDLSEPLKICGGLRVPTVVFLNEDFEFVSLLGDRTLSRYRAMAAASLGAHCPLPGAPDQGKTLETTTQDWIDEFERVHLLLLMSPKLRERHGE